IVTNVARAPESRARIHRCDHRHHRATHSVAGFPAFQRARPGFERGAVTPAVARACGFDGFAGEGSLRRSWRSLVLIGSANPMNMRSTVQVALLAVTAAFAMTASAAEVEKKSEESQAEIEKKL